LHSRKSFELPNSVISCKRRYNCDLVNRANFRYFASCWKYRYSPINREFYLAKGTEKLILGRYLLSGILLILLSLRPWGVAARPAILENRGAKSHFCDYFIIRARCLYLSYCRKCRACNSLHFLFFMFFCQINSLVVTACRNREFLLFLYLFFPHHHRGRAIWYVFFLTWCPQWA
jgi:hypothetical protein